MILHWAQWHETSLSSWVLQDSMRLGFTTGSPKYASQVRMGNEDLMHLRTGKRLAFAKCAKNTKLLKSMEFKEPGVKEWYFSTACTSCNGSMRYKHRRVVEITLPQLQDEPQNVLPTIVPLTLATHKGSHLFSFCNSSAYTNLNMHTAKAPHQHVQPFLPAHGVDSVFAYGCQDHLWGLAALPEVLLLWTPPP